MNSPYRLAPGPMMPKPLSPGSRRLRRLLIRATVVALLGVALLMLHRNLLVGYAFLFRVNDPAPSDAIVMLLGGLNHRPVEAAELYKSGLAPVILLGSSLDTPELGVSETQASLGILIRLGVPPEAIHVLPGTVTSTREEALRVREYARAHGLRRITVVTTAFHTARARWIFRKMLRGLEIDLRMAAAREPAFDESDWYKTDEGEVAYVSETLKTLYYWIAYAG
jgi:uncharacterized SAM-binding protein YcdF (DUF218 family)